MIETESNSSSIGGFAPAQDEIEMIKFDLPEIKVEADHSLLCQLETIPEKMAFKIGEAADMVGVKQYVLRYWETEFDILRPKKSKNGQRVYSRRDVQTAMLIKKLLYNDRFSIEGARAALRQLRSNVKEEQKAHLLQRSNDTAVQKMRWLLGEIQRIKQVLSI